METCKLLITLHSAKGLIGVKFFGTMDPYAVVWTAINGNEQSKPRKTKVAIKAASSPVWECPMEFDVVTSMLNNYTLMIQILHYGKLLDREIGQVEVPFKDLLDGDGFGDNISYPVKIWSGELEGEIIFSYKFIRQKDVKSSGEKENGSEKKKVIKQKKKNGMMKKSVAKNVATKVATETLDPLSAAVTQDNASNLSVAVTQDDKVTKPKKKNRMMKKVAKNVAIKGLDPLSADVGQDNANNPSTTVTQDDASDPSAAVALDEVEEVYVDEDEEEYEGEYEAEYEGVYVDADEGEDEDEDENENEGVDEDENEDEGEEEDEEEDED